jgi:hypothetical protein
MQKKAAKQYMSEIYSRPQAASRTILRVSGSFLYAATSSLKWVTDMILELVSVFIETTKYVKTTSSHTDLILRP